MTPFVASTASTTNTFNPFSPLSSPVKPAKMSTRPERTDQFYRTNLAQVDQVQEFVPCNRNNPASSRQRQCSHKSSQSNVEDCGLDQHLNVQVTTPPTPPLDATKMSSTGSSSSLHTQSDASGAGTGGPPGAWFGDLGQGWIDDPVWNPALSTPITFKTPAAKSSDKSAKDSHSSDDDYHLLSGVDKYVASFDQDLDKDPTFNPSSARLPFSTPSRPIHGNLHQSQPQHHYTQPSRPRRNQSYQSNKHSSDMDSLVKRAMRLAQGLDTPPSDRGFRAGPEDEIVDDDENNTTVFVGGINDKVTEELLSILFAPFGSIVYVKVPPAKKCGFVQFQSKEDSEYAIKQMNGFFCVGCTLRCNWGRPQNETSKPVRVTSVNEQLKDQVTQLCAIAGIPSEHTARVMEVLGVVTKGSPVTFAAPSKN